MAQVPVQPLRGQVLMPDGSTPTRRLRLVLNDDQGLRTQEILYTDSNGRFTFINLPSGRYKITIDSDGPEFATTIWEVHADPGVHLVISLQPPADQSLPASGATVLSVPAEARKAYQKAARSLQQGHNETAEEELERAIDLHPNFFEALNDLGMLYQMTDRLEEAEVYLRRAIEATGSDFRARYNLGLNLIKRERFEEGALWMRQVLESRPGLADAHFYLGVAAYGTGGLEEAEEHFLQAYELEPTSQVEALMFLGNVYHLKKDVEQAIDHFRRYLLAIPSAPNANEVKSVIERLEKERKSPLLIRTVPNDY